MRALEPELGAFPEHAAVGLLADEGDRSRLQFRRDTLEALDGSGEVAATEVAGAGGRPVGGVGDADAQPEELLLLLRVEQPRREARFVQKAPEVVAGIGEVGTGRCGNATWVDPAEDDVEAGREDVRQRAGFRQLQVVTLAAGSSGLRPSSRRSKASRRDSPETAFS